MQISKREFLKRLGLGGAGLVGGAALGDDYVATNKTLPPGAIGDPDNVWFGQRIFPMPHTIEDVPSAFMKDGKVFRPAREVPIFHETDVVVVGGGPAGFAAAMAAARSGARTALVERAGSLGGLFTNGMVLIMLATSRRDGAKYELVTRGICEEFMLRARQLGSHASTGAVPETRHWQPTVDPEAAKYLMDTMIAEAGVEMFFHAYGVDVIQDGASVKGVVFESKQGQQAILAKEVVDCTGDGDVSDQAWADYRQISHAIGFITRLGNMDRVTAKTKPTGADGKPLPGKWPTRSNEPNPSTWWGGELGPKGDGLSVRDLTNAEIEHRKRWWKHVEKMRGTPGWEETFIVNTCSQIGPRATRLLDAVTIVDRAAAKKGFDPGQTIGWFGADGPKHNAMPVPLGCIIPKKVDHVLAAGRCIGAPDTIDTFRLICPCFVTGQAAGTLAALAAASGKAPRDVPVQTLRKSLSSAGVYLG